VQVSQSVQRLKFMTGQIGLMIAHHKFSEIKEPSLPAQLCNELRVHNLHLFTYPILPTQRNSPTHYPPILLSSYPPILLSSYPPILLSSYPPILLSSYPLSTSSSPPRPFSTPTTNHPTTQPRHLLPMPLPPPSTFHLPLLSQSVKQNSAAHHPYPKLERL